MTTPQGAAESGTVGSRSIYLPGLLGRPLADRDGQVLGLSGWHRRPRQWDIVMVRTRCHLANGCSRAPRGPHIGHRSRRHHQRHGPGCAAPAERHETPVPARS